MANEIEIANAALNILGDESIASLDDETTRARLCGRFYPLARTSTLRGHRWKCALVRAELGVVAEPPLWGYGYQFQLLPKCLRVVELEDKSTVWTIEGRRLLSNSSNGKILYIKDIDAGEMDDLLTNTVIIKLAFFLAHAITDKANLVSGLNELYKECLNEARSIDAQESTPPVIECDVLSGIV